MGEGYLPEGGEGGDLDLGEPGPDLPLQPGDPPLGGTGLAVVQKVWVPWGGWRNGNAWGGCISYPPGGVLKLTVGGQRAQFFLRILRDVFRGDNDDGCQLIGTMHTPRNTRGPWFQSDGVACKRQTCEGGAGCSGKRGRGKGVSRDPLRSEVRRGHRGVHSPVVR